LVPTPDGSDDFVGVGGPSEGLRVVLGLVEESVDGGLEIDDRAEDTALQASLGEFGEKALDGVEPGSRGRGVVEDEAWMALELGTDLGILVRGIVVEDDADDLANRHLGLDGVEEADELLMPVPLHTAADDLALEHVERGEQCRRAVALVVVRHGPTPAGLQGKARLDRTALSLRLVAWSAVIVLLAAPESLTGASFQMSFAAVVALIAAWEMAAGWRRRLHERAELSSHRWLWRLAVGFAASLATTLIASVATGAFAAYHFNRLSLLGVVANLLGVPLAGFWIMPWGLLAMLLMPLGLERFALVPMGWGVEGLNAIARHVADWPQAAMLVPSLPGTSLWLLTVGGLWLCLWRRRWRLAGLPVAPTGGVR
jgi:ComEC/Rec2-related protein